MRIFNRGVEILGAGTVGDLFVMPDSPIHATLVGTARPLKDIKLPFFSDVDQILSAVQASATTVLVEGTVRQPKVRIATFAEIGDEMKNILLGETTANR